MSDEIRPSCGVRARLRAKGINVGKNRVLRLMRETGLAPTTEISEARLFGDIVKKISIVAFDALVARVMGQEPYRSARRVFWIVDGGTIHRGQCAAKRLEGQFHNLTLVHLPKHASWINQIEIYFSILQRKRLPRPTFLPTMKSPHQQIAHPFESVFTRPDLERLSPSSSP